MALRIKVLDGDNELLTAQIADGPDSDMAGAVLGNRILLRGALTKMAKAAQDEGYDVAALGITISTPDGHQIWPFVAKR